MLGSHDTGQPSANRSLWENKLGKADKLRARREAVNGDKKCGSECMSNPRIKQHCKYRQKSWRFNKRWCVKFVKTGDTKIQMFYLGHLVF